MKTDEIREAFLRFFEERDHLRRPSASLIPVDDPTLLFTNAGMVPFKPYFAGRVAPPAPRMTTIQRCFRTSDIEEVGDASHHTYFEMLGNFSVGEYFKADAIAWAWEFWTKVLKLDPERLHATVYVDDDEAYDLWLKEGVPPERIWRYTEEQGNYWTSGDIGPCGPCSELHYDFGDPATRPPDQHPDNDPDGRFLEVWNLVFMSFMQHEDGSRTPLPFNNIDTGAGLERVARAVQHVATTFDTDALRPFVEMAAGLIDRRYGEDERIDLAARVVADHARAAIYLIHDGVLPSNEGRGYVLRRMLRRAIFFARSVGMPSGFLRTMGESVIEEGRDRLPSLEEQRRLTLSTLEREEASFRRTLERGITIFEDLLASLPEGGVIPGEEVFRLYDTYGVPKELTLEMALSRGWQVDTEGFDRALEEQRERGRADDRFGLRPEQLADTYAELRGRGEVFVGYDELSAETHITGLILGAHLVERAEEGQEVGVVLATTPFYPEGGGQVGDAGAIESDTGRLEVLDTRRAESGVIVHQARVVAGSVGVNDQVRAQVDPTRRHDAARNHTGTHLLHASLRHVLGSHVRQMGSLVAPDRLRFDFSHDKPLNPDQRDATRELVNEHVRRDIAVQTRESPYDEAIGAGAIAFFGDKYGDTVRVVSIAERPGSSSAFSTELCGGTHVHETGEVGFFAMLPDNSIASGVRRVEALTGLGAERWIGEQIAYLDRATRLLNTTAVELEARILAVQGELESERKLRAGEERRRGQAAAGDIAARAERVDGVNVLIERVDVTTPDQMRAMGDTLRQKLGSSVVVLAAETNGRSSLIAAVTSDVVGRVKAGDVIKGMTGGRGGGRPEMAQGGGIDPSMIGAALETARRLVKEALSAGG